MAWKPTDSPNFAVWIAEVDRYMKGRDQLHGADLPDYNWRERYNRGEQPEAAAEACIYDTA